MKKTFFAVFVMSLIISFASLSYAVPIEINYQGYLTDLNGAPVDGTTNITFKLYDVETGGTSLWDSGTVAVDVANGVYSIILGDTSVGSTQPAIDPAIFSNQLWLGVEVETDGEMAPRQRLTATAYSIRASSADSVADGAVTNATITGPISVTKIEQGPGSTLDADTVDSKHASDLQDRVTGTCGPGSSVSAVNPDGSVVCTPTGLTGTVTGNYVPKSDGTGLVDSTIFDNGNVGIGTNTPAGELHVSKPQALSPVTFNGTGPNDIAVDDSSYSGKGTTSYIVRVQNDGPSPDVIEYSSNGGTTWSAPTDMVISGLAVGKGVFIGFASTDGHTFGDQWEWTVSQGFPDGLIVSDGKVTVKDITITTGAVSGRVLTSDAAGNASWQPTAPDADSDPANELQTISLVGTDLTLSDGGGTVSIADNDNDPANEFNTSVTMNGTTLNVNDAGGAKSLDLAGKLSIDDLSDSSSTGSNVFIGASAGASINGAVSNTGVGIAALSNTTTGSGNSAFGRYTLFFNTEGNYNTALGYGAGYLNQTGSGNVFLGSYAGHSETGSDKLYIDNSSTSSPLIYGDFSANSLTVNGTLTSTVGLSTNGSLSVSGNSALNGSLTVSGNSAIGTSPESTYTLKVAGDSNDSYVAYFNSNVTSGTAYSIYAVSNMATSRTINDYHFAITGAAYGAYENYGVRGYANDSNATYNYGVYGQATAGGTVSYAGYFSGDLAYTGTLTDVSDVRLKENIKPVENALAKVQGINGVYFNMKETPEQTEVGVIAQDVQKVLPEAVSEMDAENGYLGVSYPALIPVLIEAVKEQQSIIDNQQKQIDDLRVEIEALKNR